MIMLRSAGCYDQRERINVAGSIRAFSKGVWGRGGKGSWVVIYLDPLTDGKCHTILMAESRGLI